MSVDIESYEEVGDGVFQVRFRNGFDRLDANYTHRQTDWFRSHWEMELYHAPDGKLRVEDVPMIEAAIHELKRLNGTLPPVRIGGLRPAKGGE